MYQFDGSSSPLQQTQLQGKCSIRATGRPQISLIHFFLTGEIPASLGNCIKLKTLWLHRNQLTGERVVYATLSPENLLSKILHTRTFTGTESSEKILKQQLPGCSITV
jgi:hypothetical protein